MSIGLLQLNCYVVAYKLHLCEMQMYFNMMWGEDVKNKSRGLEASENTGSLPQVPPASCKAVPYPPEGAPSRLFSLLCQDSFLPVEPGQISHFTNLHSLWATVSWLVNLHNDTSFTEVNQCLTKGIQDSRGRWKSLGRREAGMFLSSFDWEARDWEEDSCKKIYSVAFLTYSKGQRLGQRWRSLGVGEALKTWMGISHFDTGLLFFQILSSSPRFVISKCFLSSGKT